MVTYNDLTPVERKWVDEFIRGMSTFAAYGPPEEAPEEFREEVREVRKIFEEKRDMLADKARIWRTKLLEVLTMPPA